MIIQRRGSDSPPLPPAPARPSREVLARVHSFSATGLAYLIGGLSFPLIKCCSLFFRSHLFHFILRVIFTCCFLPISLCELSVRWWWLQPRRGRKVTRNDVTLARQNDDKGTLAIGFRIFLTLFFIIKSVQKRPNLPQGSGYVLC